MRVAPLCRDEALVPRRRRAGGLHPAQVRLLLAELVEQAGREVRAAAPQAVHGRAVAVYCPLAAQVDGLRVAERVREEVEVRQLGALHEARQRAVDDVEVGVAPVGVVLEPGRKDLAKGGLVLRHLRAAPPPQRLCSRPDAAHLARQGTASRGQASSSARNRFSSVLASPPPSPSAPPSRAAKRRAKPPRRSSTSLTFGARTPRGSESDPSCGTYQSTSEAEAEAEATRWENHAGAFAPSRSIHGSTIAIRNSRCRTPPHGSAAAEEAEAAALSAVAEAAAAAPSPPPPAWLRLLGPRTCARSLSASSCVFSVAAACWSRSRLEPRACRESSRLRSAVRRRSRSTSVSLRRELAARPTARGASGSRPVFTSGRREKALAIASSSAAEHTASAALRRAADVRSARSAMRARMATSLRTSSCSGASGAGSWPAA
mmetsp:Transcript_7278/g.23964  ORF Transcript_7278/g.23964 Transcript_7278/m.23964 type:complete len:432 (-) Transcript_7278:91-1386(-)